MLSVKTVATLAIIVGCFAVLYPRFLHPLMLRMLGVQTSAKGGEDSSEFYPPGRRSPGDGSQPPQNPPQPDMRQHMMRGGPHPGMRAAAEMQKQHSTHGSGRGMMGVVLPMYAVGIIGYLIYTLVKVFGKKDKNESQDSWNSQGDMFENLSAEDLADRPPGQKILSKSKTKELEDLLLKADDKSINEQEMRALQKRLEETESQMTQILRAMQQVQNKVSKISPDDGETAKGEGSVRASDSSPDMDSYEIVNKGDKKTDSEADSSTSVENIKSEEAKENTDGKESPPSDNKVDENETGDELSEKCGDEDEKDDESAEEEEEDAEESDDQEVVLTRKEEEESEDMSVRHRQVPQH